MKRILSRIVFTLVVILVMISTRNKAIAFVDTTYLRISIHVFSDSTGNGNFSPDSVSHVSFLNEMLGWINHRLTNLDTLKPAVPSPFVASVGVQLILDSIFYHHDNHAWDCSKEIDSDYMRAFFVDKDTSLSYRQKYQTLPIFLGGNYNVVGGHNSLIGDKRFIAMRGIYSEFETREIQNAVRDCGRGLLHELGHSLGLSHNFMGGEHGNQCDECLDNGCPEEGTSNNIMDYWPSYGYALSACQLEIIEKHLRGERGTISDVIYNDSCYSVTGRTHMIYSGTELIVDDTLFLHGDMIVESGAKLIVEGYLSFAEGTGLIINQGAEVVLLNSTVGNLCGDLWEGIQYVCDGPDVDNPGSLTINGGLIENAQRGIYTNCPARIQITDAIFRNNKLALEIIGDNDPGELSSTLFEITRKIYHWEEGEFPDVFVKIGKGAKVRFENCDFINKEGHRKFEDNKSGIGILVENAGVDVVNCSFYNLFKGIYATGTDHGSKLQTDSCTFEFCHCGIQVRNYPKATVQNCNFSLNRLNTMSSIGVHTKNVPLLEVNGSLFTTDYGGDFLVGIISDYTIPGTHIIESNIFEGLHTGVFTIPGPDKPGWPQALWESNLPDLHKKPVGPVCIENQFTRVDQEFVKMFYDGHGIASGTVSDFKKFEVSFSREYPVGGFAAFTFGQNYLSSRVSQYCCDNQKDAISFFVFTDSSWFHESSSVLSDEDFTELVENLRDSWYKGKNWPVSLDNLTHKDMVLLTRHLESYPWLAVDPSFKDYIFENLDFIPHWFWMEIQEALSQKESWKMNLHELIVFLARKQINQEENNFVFASFEENEPAWNNYKIPIDFEPLSDLGKLNIGFEKQSGDSFFSIIPNPNSGEFGIGVNEVNYSMFDDKDWKYYILNTGGQIIRTGRIKNTADLLIDIRPVPPGLYLIEIWSSEEFLGIQKFIIFPN